MYAKPKERFDVHFHVEDGVCEGAINGYVWDAGGYFTEEVIKDDVMHIFAHFEPLRVGLLAGSPEQQPVRVS